MLKNNNDNESEVRHSPMPSIYTQSCKERIPPLHSTIPAPDGFPDMGDSNNGDQNKGACLEAPYSMPVAKIEVFNRDADYYTDKNITDRELSEVIVCFKDVSCHDVKDICIDDGPHFPDKNMIEINEGDEKISFSQNQFAKYKNDKVTKDLLNNAVTVSDDFEVSPANAQPVSVSDKDDVYQCSSERLPKGGCKLDSKNQLTGNSSSEGLCAKQMPTHKELDMDLVQVEKSCCGCSNFQEPFEPQNKIDQIRLEEKNPVSTSMSSAMNEQSNDAKETAGDLKEESDIITFEFDSGAAAGSGSFKREENAGADRSSQAQNDLKIEETSSDDIEASKRSLSVHQSYGESIFPSSASLSGPIGFSGHIPYSGSISFHSDSSATSARSFAFPILQSEWNSSPVRMAKAEHRHQKKYRGWRMRLICCRF